VALPLPGAGDVGEHEPGQGGFVVPPRGRRVGGQVLPPARAGDRVVSFSPFDLGAVTLVSPVGGCPDLYRKARVEEGERPRPAPPRPRPEGPARRRGPPWAAPPPAAGPRGPHRRGRRRC